ncbi:MAG: MBL fold metallo-hydrolase [Candidatus Pacebacteria bacterium]|nr:MBL fold metallo-hydrolase [Candidatus Paceibacterota bacterium]MDP6659399.1 MBL fold metallo-hydrolase [Candidatus Paceibacterota bacterium]
MRDHFKVLSLTVFFLINVFIWTALLSEEHGELLTVAFLNVGQGDAIFVEAPNGSQMLIDGGPDRSVLRELEKLMPFYDRSIDVVVATHPDKDHIAGLVEVLERYNVDYFIESGAKSDTGVYESLAEVLGESNAEQVLARRGMKINLSDEASFNILFPDRDVSEIDTNAASIIGKLVYGDTSFMLTGDSPKSIEKYLVEIDGKSLQSTVLKAGHHGSKTSTDISFLGFVDPEHVVVSAGEKNRYGHPNKEVTDLFEQFEIPLLNTFSGAALFISDGENLRFK